MEVIDIEHYKEKSLDRMFGVNVKGQTKTTLELLDDLKRNGAGTIVNLASNVGIVTAAMGTTLYSLTKAASIMLTKRLAFDLHKYNIQVTGVLPGWFKSAMTVVNRTEEEIENIKQYFKERTNLGMLGKHEYIAKVVLFLYTIYSEFMNGQIIVADGGELTI